MDDAIDQRPSAEAKRIMERLARTPTEPHKEAPPKTEGVVLDDLRDAATEPRSLFPSRDPAKSARLMSALDAVNARFGRGALRPLATGLARPWGTRHGRVSPRYTTRVDELMEAEAW